MNFREFQQRRSELLASTSDLADFAETNLWKSLADLVPILPAESTHVHRCHLAQAWLATFGMSAEWAQRALVSCGVRHSLSLLFPLARQNELQLRIPADVYPVYAELASAAGLAFDVFPTLPDLRIPRDGDWLLLPNPLKPAGRWLLDDEVTTLKKWLADNPARRLLLDAVYTFGTQWHPTTQSLIDTGQTILLHSLSKGWLHPQIFGIALVPEADLSSIASAFRDNSPPQENLQKASRLLRSHSNCPRIVAERLAALRAATMGALPAILAQKMAHPAGADPAGYLIPLAFPWDDVLEQHRLLTIPLSVFGAKIAGCVISTLGAARSAPAF